MDDELLEYRALLEKVARFSAAVEARRAADLACRRGCDGCCHVQLDVLGVEARAIEAHLASLPADVRERVRRRAGDESDRCVMLNEDGSCAVYEARPLVCRTQGHALDYPPGVVPVDAVRARAHGDVTWCPLNYRAAPPDGADVLRSEVLDELLFVVARRFAEARGEDPRERTSLSRLAAG